MKRLLRFILPFLFVRDWHSGDYEISRERLVLFCAALGFVVLGIIIIAFLQAPVGYTQTS